MTRSTMPLGETYRPHFRWPRMYDTRFPKDRGWTWNRGGFYIDIGARLRDAALVKEGMAGVELVLKSAPERHKPRFLYNLANGHLALNDLAKSEPGFRYDPQDTPLTPAKAAFREAISGERHIDLTLQAKLRVNYANCLSQLGRPLEALAQYDRALSYDPEHAMAWGNLAVEMKHLASIARDSTLRLDAESAVREALEGDRLERIGEGHARQQFLRLLETIEGVAPLAVPEEPENKKPHGKGARLKRYEEFCAKNQLFLNLDALHRRHRTPRVDSMYFPLITGLKDDATFPRLARVFSEAKECYAVARLLLFEAVDHPYATRGYDGLTYIPYSLDYSVHGIRPGKLKAAFATAYNVLDKLAVFIGRYMGIEGADRTDFERLWFEDDELRKLRSDICRTGNYLLFGLHDMSRVTLTRSEVTTGDLDAFVTGLRTAIWCCIRRIEVSGEPRSTETSTMLATGSSPR